MPDSRGSKRNRPNPDDPESILCKICFSILDHPVEFPCDNGHFFCAQCLYKNLKVEKNVTCPICRKRAGAWARRFSQHGKKDLFSAVKDYVDTDLHERIRLKYPQGDGTEVLEEAGDDIVHHLIAEPGEVAKEFREQLEQLREEEESVSRKCIQALQAEEEEEIKRRVSLEQADAQLAALLQKEESSERNVAAAAAGPSSAKKDTKKSPFRGLRQISLKDCVNHIRGKSENKENRPGEHGLTRSVSLDSGEVTERHLRELFECCKEDGQDFESFVREQRSNFTEVEGAKSQFEQDRILAAKVQEELNKRKKSKMGPIDFFFRNQKQKLNTSSSNEAEGTSSVSASPSTSG